MFREMEIVGSLGCRPIDYPNIINLVEKKALVVEPLVTAKYKLEEINTAFDVMRRGEGVRTIVLCQ